MDLRVFDLGEFPSFGTFKNFLSWTVRDSFASIFAHRLLLLYLKKILLLDIKDFSYLDFSELPFLSFSMIFLFKLPKVSSSSISTIFLRNSVSQKPRTG